MTECFRSTTFNSSPLLNIGRAVTMDTKGILCEPELFRILVRVCQLHWQIHKFHEMFWIIPRNEEVPLTLIPFLYSQPHPQVLLTCSTEQNVYWLWSFAFALLFVNFLVSLSLAFFFKGYWPWGFPYEIWRELELLSLVGYKVHSGMLVAVRTSGRNWRFER